MSNIYHRRREAVLAALAQRPSSGDPTPEEIAAGCEQIQRTWSEREERYRRTRPKRWSLQELRAVDYCEG